MGRQYAALVADGGQLEVEGLAAHKPGAARVGQLHASKVFAGTKPLLSPGNVSVWPSQEAIAAPGGKTTVSICIK